MASLHALSAWSLLLLLQASPLVAGWCETGISQPVFDDDAGTPSVDIMVAQSPLFSSNPKIGKKLELLNLYHTALVLSQRVPGVAPKNWTVEFDSVTNVLGAVLPDIKGDQLFWSNDARYCLTEGVLWGEKHWSKQFQVVLRVTAADARRVFAEFVGPLNRTSHHQKPLYQLWKVTSWSKGQSLIPAITCGEGTNWILHFAKTTLGARLVQKDFQLRATSFVFHADRLERIDEGNATQWAEVVQYFREMVNLTAKGENALERLLELWHMMPVKIVYDSNAAKYYHLIGNHFPWFEARYEADMSEMPAIEMGKEATFLV